MATAVSEIRHALGAAVTWESRTIRDCFVDISDRAGNRVARFRVNRRKGQRPTFTDTRGEGTGTGGTGIWGTTPELRAGNRRCYLTPTAFKIELQALVGPESAEDILRKVLQ